MLSIGQGPALYLAQMVSNGDNLKKQEKKAMQNTRLAPSTVLFNVEFWYFPYLLLAALLQRVVLVFVTVIVS